MKPPMLRGASEEFANQLPPIYKNWLDFYDQLPENLRADPAGVKWQQLLDEMQYIAMYGKAPAHLDESRMIAVEYRVSRDYVLARIAEELLPARLTYDQLHALEKAEREAETASENYAYRQANNVIRPLWQVARPK